MSFPLVINQWEKLFSLNACEATRWARALQAASAYERWEFWRETHTPLWLLIGRIIFLTREKTSFAILIGRIFLTSENHRSLLWLARTNLRTKIYDIAFWWVFLSMYIVKMVNVISGTKFTSLEFSLLFAQTVNLLVCPC